jgi:hypothetical protein
MNKPLRVQTAVYGWTSRKLSLSREHETCGGSALGIKACKAPFWGQRDNQAESSWAVSLKQEAPRKLGTSALQGREHVRISERAEGTPLPAVAGQGELRLAA